MPWSESLLNPSQSGSSRPGSRDHEGRDAEPPDEERQPCAEALIAADPDRPRGLVLTVTRRESIVLRIGSVEVLIALSERKKNSNARLYLSAPDTVRISRRDVAATRAAGRAGEVAKQGPAKPEQGSAPVVFDGSPESMVRQVNSDVATAYLRWIQSPARAELDEVGANLRKRHEEGAA